MSEKRDVDPSDGRDESPSERADRNWDEILQELRVTQTGTQIIGGFLVTVAFQQRFASLDASQLIIYGVLVALATLNTLLGIATVSVHRSGFGKHEKSRIVHVADRLLSVTVWTVALLAVGVALFVFDFVFGVQAGIVAGLVAAGAAVLLILLVPRRAA